jgi:membrane fusion protein, heavy metal efflux system
MLAPATTGTTATEKVEKEERSDSVVLSDAKIAAAGIELATASAGVLRDSLLLNGMVQPNQEALVQVTPRFPGIVREVRKRIGDRVEKGDVLAVVESNQSLTSYELKAAIAGTVVDRQTTLGEYASEQKPAFVIADLSTVWVDFSVYRRDLSRVHAGDQVVIDPADGGATVDAKISYLSPVGSSDTQSALARAVVANAEQRLRPGLFITGRLSLSAKPVGVAVKSSAVQTIENRNVVFVRNGDKFEARDVELGEQDSELVEIIFGVLEGDVYAAKNSFIVKSELAKGTADTD